jgi:GT2 family glycosyltransferase
VLRSSVVIATYHRPDFLAKALLSILEQTRLPEEVVIVDDGDLGEFPIKQRFVDKGIRTQYKKKTKRGLPESRRIGVSLSGGDIILFIDDDVVLLPDYIEQVLRVFESDEIGEIAGVGGSEANDSVPRSIGSRLRRLRDIVFLMGGFQEGRVLPSGYCTEYGSTGRPIIRLTDVDFLIGASSAYRRWVCEQYPFSIGYRALGEDKDFSFRVSRDHRVLINPDAKLFHYQTPVLRENREIRGRRGVLGRYIFFRRYLLTSSLRWLFFTYAVTGHIFSRLLIAVTSRDPGDSAQLRGMLLAVREIMTGKVDIRGERQD